MMRIGNDIEEAAYWLRKGEVVAIPTETVYGLAANIYNEKAVEKIYTLKNRPKNNPLIVHLKSDKELSKYAVNIPVKAKILAQTFWPGPLTLVLEKSAQIPSHITSGKDTVGLRVPAKKILLELLHELDFPLAAPSANPSNRTSATSTDHIIEYFKGKPLAYALEGGACEKGLESTIIGFDKGEPVIYRLGALSIELIEKVVGKVTVFNKATEIILVPGMFSKHYAPKTKLLPVEDWKDYCKNNPNKKIALLTSGTLLETIPNYVSLFNLSVTHDLDEVARNLYKTLFEIDQLEFDEIIFQYFPENQLGTTINDRLTRASNI
ncbi:L-threonylcarbamoyladenylate synthase [Flavobacterium haoranii]|uniref:Threonylcarbamoyl-AMP synthase n=1 Tax=Flavobacterium haoranii TaxID=683124 RepID=A0A1M6J110_9FLAO|nr:L-threonylcarbamoyladenylate synthase [Flavobacterium haoranii]SHJ40309.1 translation factor SUA5 [Flavobacterium haoranii]